MGQPDRDFTLRQLRTFICAARAGSFSHAATELGISQPAVSDQIALLEDRLGQTLFFRRLGTTPKLTPEGAKLLETAGSLIDTSKAMCRDEGGHKQHHLRLCLGPRVLDLHLKPMLPLLYRDFPGLNIELLHRIPPSEVQTALARGRVDLVVYTLTEIGEPWQNSRVVGDVMTVMAGPPGIGHRIEAGLEKIEDLQFILPSPGQRPGSWTNQQFERLGIRLSRPIIFLEFTDVIQQMVEGGQGVTMLTYEGLAEGIAAGRLEIFGPRLPPLQRVIARSARAPHLARMLEERLIKAMSGLPPRTQRM